MCTQNDMVHDTSDVNLASANRDHYNASAHNYSNQIAATGLYSGLSSVLLKSYPFDPTSTEVMEFACGSGLVSQEISPYCKSLLGVDISESMIGEFIKLVQEKDLNNMRAVVTQLKGVDGELDDARFDVIICCSAYHHFASLKDVTRILVHFLKQSGVLLVTDLLEFSTTGDKAVKHYGHIAPHTHGLKKETVVEAFESNGLKDVSVDFAMVAPKEMFGLAADEIIGEVSIFIAKGTK